MRSRKARAQCWRITVTCSQISPCGATPPTSSRARGRRPGFPTRSGCRRSASGKRLRTANRRTSSAASADALQGRSSAALQPIERLRPFDLPPLRVAEELLLVRAVVPGERWPRDRTEHVLAHRTDARGCEAGAETLARVRPSRRRDPAGDERRAASVAPVADERAVRPEARETVQDSLARDQDWLRTVAACVRVVRVRAERRVVDDVIAGALDVLPARPPPACVGGEEDLLR